MRLTVFGAGAIGGYLAAKMAATGRVDLSVVARGAHLAAIEKDGLRLVEDGKETAVPVRAAERAADLGVQDYVILALKAHSVGPALAQIADAKLVCNRCPVTTECLSWALESGQDAGVWGGMSEDERRALKRRNARTRARSSV